MSKVLADELFGRLSEEEQKGWHDFVRFNLFGQGVSKGHIGCFICGCLETQKISTSSGWKCPVGVPDCFSFLKSCVGCRTIVANLPGFVNRFIFSPLSLFL